MITANDLLGKTIPAVGTCPICFDRSHTNTREYKNLRNHLVQSHGFPRRTCAEQTAMKTAWARTRSRHAEYERNKTKNQARSREYYLLHKAEVKARAAAYRKAHAAEITEKQRAYRLTHAAEIKTRSQAYYRTCKAKKQPGGGAA